MNTLKNTTPLILALLLGITPSVYAMKGGIATGINYFANQSAFFTLNPKVPPKGPIYEAGTPESEYVQKLFQIIVKKGDLIGREYRDEGNLQTYFAFLLGSLVVPYHESQLLQFIKHDPISDRCREKVNSGEFLNGKREKDKPLNPLQAFQKYFKETKPVVIPKCATFVPTESAIQYLGSLDRLSAGMMQIVLHWHIEGYVQDGKHLSVEDTVEYGLRYYYEGFNQVFRNARPAGHKKGARYSCVFKKGTSHFDYFDLIRGNWAGKYNNGSEDYTCRIYNTPPVNADTKERDSKFKEDLERFTETGENLFSIHLQGDLLEAYQEIMDGYAGTSKSTTALDRLLGGK